MGGDGIEGQQSPEQCVDQGFDLLAEKQQGFPEFDEALKNQLLDKAAQSFREAGMTPQQVQDTFDMWFPENVKGTPFYSEDVERFTILDVFKQYSDYYEGIDLDKAAQAIQAVYDDYEERKVYVEEYSQIEQKAHQGAIDCHLDVNRDILQDYQRRIRDYCKKEEIPLGMKKRLIESLELAKNSIYAGDYEFVRDNFDEIKSVMLTQISEIGQRGMGVYANKFTDEQLRYLHGIGVALVRASLDDVATRRNKN